MEQRTTAALSTWEFMSFLLAIPLSIVVGAVTMAKWRHQTVNEPRTTVDQTATTGSGNRGPIATEECPICLGHCEWSCSTLCGHFFCTECLLTYWRGRATSSPLSCPMCRTLIRLLIPEFSSDGDGQNDEGRAARLQDIGEYNAAHGLSRAATWAEARASSVPLLRSLLRSFERDPRSATRSLVGAALRNKGLSMVLILGFFYVASPFDLVPEVSLLSRCEQVLACDCSTKSAAM